MFTIAITLLLPDIFDKYKLEFIRASGLDFNAIVSFDDLDGDNCSEQIIFGNNHKGQGMVYVRSHTGKTIGQYNLNCSLANMHEIITNNFNHSNLKWIFIFSQSNDSIFLNGLDIYTEKKFLIERRFVTTVHQKNGKYDYFFSEAKFSDLDGDGSEELVFAVNGGYSIFPRKVFIYNIKKDELITSAECGNVIQDFTIFDIDDDGSKEIFTSTWSPSNYPETADSVLITDRKGLLFAFNNKLKYFFKPIAFAYSLGNVITLSGEGPTNKKIIAFIKVYGNDSLSSSLLLINKSGEIEKKVMVPKVESPFTTRHGRVIKNRDELIIPTNVGRYFMYNLELEFLEEKKLEFADGINSNIIVMDLNNDGSNEFVINAVQNNKMYILDDNFKNMLSYSFQNDSPILLSTLQLGDKHPQFCVQKGKQLLLFEYRINPMHYWEYVIYSVIFLLILFLNLLINKMQKNQIRRRFAMKQKLNELQLKSIRNQLEPHFTFNALNSIAAVIYDERKELAYNFFTKFSKLIRQTLESSDQISRTLHEELDFVNNYLDIQKFRFGEKLSFEINIAEGVNREIMVPKMMLQAYAENAIKHGIAHLKGPGSVIINIRNESNELVCEIIDNGVGRKKAKEIGSRSTGKGDKIMKQYFELFNEYYHTKIDYQVEDLYDETGIPSGTKVIIKLSIN